LKYLRPRNLQEALRALRESGAIPLAGGTDLMVHLGRDREWPGSLVDLKGLPELRGLERRDGLLRIGAACTLAELAESPLLNGLPALRQTTAHFAGRQIRNRATVGGNLVNASPASDLAPVLLVHEALCVTDRRRIPLEGFATGPGSTRLDPGEVLVCVEIPLPPEGSREFFVKLAPREAMAIAVVNLAALLVMREGRCALARVALGSVAPTVMRAGGCESALQGSALDAESLALAARRAAEECAPIDDIRAGADYRRLMVERLLAWELGRIAREDR